MITAFVGGTLVPLQDKGNGKTATMTFALLLAKYPKAKINLETGKITLGKPSKTKIFTNYYVSFADKIMSPEEMVHMFLNDELRNCIVAIDEMQVLFDSHFGIQRSKGKKVSLQELIMRLAQQSRKRNVEIYYTTQRFANVHKVLRVHTNYVFEPVKYHYDGNICILDKCKEKHIIRVYDLMYSTPTWEYPLDIILPFYNSEEIIFTPSSMIDLRQESKEA